MTLSPKLKTQPKISEEALIRKGGSSGTTDGLEQAEEAKPFKRVQVRIPLDYLSRIAVQLDKRPGNVARHTWLIEAIAEKLGKEETTDEVEWTSSQP